MSINNLYISHQFYNWGEYPVKSLSFLNQKNLQKLIHTSIDQDCYTSLEDIGAENIQTLCNSAKKIQLVDIDYAFLGSNVPESFLYFQFLYFLSTSENQHKVDISDITQRIVQDLTQISQQRTTDGQVLWTLGCSMTAGVGVDHTQRYGHLLSKMLALPEITLSRNGGSILWASDQVLRSNIKPGDIVVWGLTTFARIDIADKFNIKSRIFPAYRLLDKQDQLWHNEYFFSRLQHVLCMRYILQVINFCNQIGAKLYIVNLLDRTLGFLLENIHKHYIDLTKDNNFESGLNFIDLGTDGSHPGPKQHQEYADKIFNLIRK
jgi:hypothetical protein